MSFPAAESGNRSICATFHDVFRRKWSEHGMREMQSIPEAHAVS